MDGKRQPRRRTRMLAALAVAAAVGAGTGVGAYALTADSPGSATGPQAAATAGSTTQVASTSLGVGEIYERSAAGVVDIAVTGGGGGFGQTGGEGSGFVLDKEGSIVTNAHVVEGAGTITVTFANGEEAPATLVGVDESTDVAIIDVDLPSEELTPLGLGTSADVEIGDPVVAIGSPFGLAGTVTSGIVSALDRTVDSPNGYPIAGAIQTDAAINPGNSGGPLLDATGKVIGVNAQIASNSGGNDGVGFAIPIDTVRGVAERLVAGEAVEHAYLGVSLATVGPSAAGALGVPEGVQVVSVQPGSPAAEAGLRAGTSTTDVAGETYASDGDVITALDGKPVRSADDLGAAIAQHEPGDSVTLTVYRDGSSTSVDVTLGVRPA